MKAYKIFKRVNGKLQSGGDIFPELVFTYKTSGWNTPKIRNSQFFCFVSLHDAERFIADQRAEFNDVYELWEIEAEDPQPRAQGVTVWANWRTGSHRLETLTAVRTFWKEGTSDLMATLCDNVHVTPRVKLIKKIS